MILEVCVDSVESAVNAEAGGADRIEFIQTDTDEIRAAKLVMNMTNPAVFLIKK